MDCGVQDDASNLLIYNLSSFAFDVATFFQTSPGYSCNVAFLPIISVSGKRVSCSSFGFGVELQVAFVSSRG